jgi:hypothetical protein
MIATGELKKTFSMNECSGPVTITDRIKQSFGGISCEMASEPQLEPPSGGRVKPAAPSGLFRNQISCDQPLFDKVKLLQKACVQPRNQSTDSKLSSHCLCSALSSRMFSKSHSCSARGTNAGSAFSSIAWSTARCTRSTARFSRRSAASRPFT